MALANDPRLLLLDDPTAGMNPEETMMMMNLITKLAEDRTVVLVEHKMKLVMGISDRIIVLHHGELLADGAPGDIRANDEVRLVSTRAERVNRMLTLSGLNAWYYAATSCRGSTWRYARVKSSR